MYSEHVQNGRVQVASKVGVPFVTRILLSEATKKLSTTFASVSIHTYSATESVFTVIPKIQKLVLTCGR